MMNKCPNCGYEVPFNEKFCGKCGARIFDEESDKNQANSQSSQNSENQGQDYYNELQRRRFYENEYSNEFKKGWNESAESLRKFFLGFSKFLGKAFPYILAILFIGLLTALIIGLTK